MSPNNQLADRCEKATGPDREMDCLIYGAVHGPRMLSKEQRPYCPRYTASLDAAMTLVPEGWLLLALNQRTEAEIGEAKATSIDPAEAAEWFATLRTNTEDRSYRLVASQLRQGSAATPALALAAAALRARQS